MSAPSPRVAPRSLNSKWQNPPGAKVANRKSENECLQRVSNNVAGRKFPLALLTSVAVGIRDHCVTGMHFARKWKSEEIREYLPPRDRMALHRLSRCNWGFLQHRFALRPICLFLGF
jgi:hypothetical protein